MVNLKIMHSCCKKMSLQYDGDTGDYIDMQRYKCVLLHVIILIRYNCVLLHVIILICEGINVCYYR